MTDPPAGSIATPAFLAAGAPAAVLGALPGARAVGGCVRDTLAGLPVHDVDIAAPLPPAEIARRLEAAGLRVFETGLKHGTVTAVLDHQPVEVTALRRDVVTDGRHAEVAWTTDWHEDAARRDFRINAMSLAADGRLWDYFGGREDLAAGRVRFVGDPATRLAEDYLRALRFFRFWARFGRGEADADALAAIGAAVPGLMARIAPERIWMELKRLLEAPDPVAALALMDGIGLLRAVLPEAGDRAPLRRLVERGAPADPLLRLAALLRPEAVAAIAARLRLATAEQEALREDTAAREPAADEAGGLRGWLARRTREHALAALWLAESRDGLDRSALRAAIAAMAMPAFPLLGRDLLELGLPPGPAVGQLLHALREQWIADGAIGDRDACIAEAKRRMVAGAAYGSAAPT
jgi:poly(A) polymerase/tRNA nucleotidyltransferase (CCA-adding enzyme)